MRNHDFYRNIARYCRRRLREKGAAASAELSDQLQQWAVECDGQADRTLREAPARDLLDRARHHRLRAEEYRAVAEQMQTPSARDSYHHLAESYDAMARQLEKLGSNAERHGEKAG